MNDFEGLLSTNYGFKSSSKSTPMASSKSSNAPSSSFNLGDFRDVFSNSKSTVSNNRMNDGKFSNASNSVNFESIFGGGGGDTTSLPVFDKPVYDDDIISSSIDDIFASKKSGGLGSGSGGSGSGGGDAFDHLLGGLGKKEPLSSKSKSMRGDKAVSKFDDLLPGFGGVSSINRSSSDATKKSSSVLDDPFVLESTSHRVSSSSGVFRDPLEEVGNLNNLGSKNFEKCSGVSDDIGNLDSSGNKIFSTKVGERGKYESPLRRGSRVSGSQTLVGAEGGVKSSVTGPERGSEKKAPVEDFGESPQSVLSVPNASSPVYKNTGSKESNSSDHVSLHREQNTGSFDEVWLTVSEIPLFTQPTTAPPPFRPPPSRPGPFSRVESGSFPPSNAQRKVNEYSSFHGPNDYFHTPKSAPAGATTSFASSLDDLEEFAAERNQNKLNENSYFRSGEDLDTDLVAAAAAKEAMDKDEAKFRYAKEERERESSKAFRSRESATVENAEKADMENREFGEGQERQQRDIEEVNRRQKEEDDRRRIEKEREEKDKEKRRVERERELARQAIERAAREARERAAVEARRKAERAAVQKANAEARERAERAAVQRAQAEARERATAIAKEKADKAAADEREKARSEAQEKEVRGKAAAATSNMTSQQNEPDFESLFGVGSRASSAPRPRTTSSNKPVPEATRTSVNSASTMRKASSSTSIVDDLTSIFGEAPSSSRDFQDIDGETDDRRRARLERQKRTQERAAKALAEKNARDLEAQREQAERRRISETLDVEIKRWAAGKEGNLRALLSTLQYVLWPECGWQPVSLTDLITGASVKKAYRKATLCIHPDKVQQKGANLQQKYVAEKVFDMLKEAWNKFNSEELF